MIVFQEDYCVIKTEGTIVTQIWKGFANEQQFQKAILKTLELFKTGKYNAIMSDTKESKAVGTNMLKWLDEEINPQLVTNGLRKMAFILSESVVTKMGTDQFQKQAGSELETGSFSSQEDAIKWINS